MKALCTAALLLLTVLFAHAAEPGLLPPGEASEAPGAEAATPLVAEPTQECGKTPQTPCPQTTGVEAGAQALGAGAAAPNPEVDDPDGKPQPLLPKDANRPTLVVFWSLFCEPCKDEFPLFSQLGRDYGKKGLDTVVVNLDGLELSKTMKGFLKMNRSTLRAVVDRKEGKRSLAAEAYGVTGTPSLFLIGRDGVVRWSHVGRVDSEKLEAEIRGALGS